MGWKGNLVDIPLGAAARLLGPPAVRADEPDALFVLRTNDIGDLLVVTPLFDALRRRFPRARIVAGIGPWNRDTLRHNPHLSGVIELDAPWNNRYVANQGWPAVARWLAASPEVRRLRAERFDVGIDVLGSHVGSALMLRAGIPWRLGVRGYRGGHTATQQWVEYDPDQHVGRAALRFAELLGATSLPEPRPQLFLTPEERTAGESSWTSSETGHRGPRIVIGIGGGFAEKCWPVERFQQIISLLERELGARCALVGGPGDVALAQRIAEVRPAITNFTGTRTLRETFALVAAADAVVTNPSMLMHVAAAFTRPTVVTLGPYFSSAAQHDLQWGYPGSCRSLGHEATVAQAVDALAGLMGRGSG